MSRSTVVCLHQDATVFIPNTFSPTQSEGLNDYFAPKGLHIKNYTMKIYNRWGELIFNNKRAAAKSPLWDLGVGWDGTFRGHDVPEGVYLYLIAIEDYNGHESYFKGNVTIIK